MKKLKPGLALFLVLISVSLAGCVQNQENSMTNSSNNLKVFFYFLPGCPSCEKIKPYMNLMREEVKEVEFDFCDVSNFSSCSKESVEAIKDNLTGTPTVVIVRGENVTVLLGWEEVSQLGDYLNEYGIETPTVFYKNETFNIQDCVVCHNKRGLPPPSTYTCTYCCHSG